MKNPDVERAAKQVKRFLAAIGLSLLWGAAMLPFSASAIIIRDDRNEVNYLKLGERYQSLLCRMLSFGGEGTLIAPRWVLTAAHVGKAMRSQAPNGPVLINGKDYTVEKIIIHPQWGGKKPDHDLAMVKLKESVNEVTPVQLYRNMDEDGKIVTIVGRGYSGTGLTGPVNNDHRWRGATNKIDEASKNILIFKFDDPKTGKAIELEGVSGPNDSGGPAFIQADGTLYLVGVSSSSKGSVGQYGQKEYYARVSSELSWIEQTMRKK